jgi:hypothetical protein
MVRAAVFSGVSMELSRLFIDKKGQLRYQAGFGSGWISGVVTSSFEPDLPYWRYRMVGPERWNKEAL